METTKEVDTKVEVEENQMNQLEQQQQDACSSRPFECTECKKSFKFGGHLKNHMKKWHNKRDQVNK